MSREIKGGGLVSGRTSVALSLELCVDLTSSLVPNIDLPAVIGAKITSPLVSAPLMPVSIKTLTQQKHNRM